jgi:hypothetical protein
MQMQKEIDGHLFACQQILKESHIVNRLDEERATIWKINDINDISFLERLTAIIVVL